MAKKILFDGWKQWKVCFMAGVEKFLWGICRIITAIILGIASVFAWLWRCICSFVSNNPKVTLCAFVVIAALVWLLTFVNMRCRAVGAENQRDSIAWQYQNFKEKHGYE